MKTNKIFILKICALVLLSIKIEGMNHQARGSIAKSIARQAGVERCDNRVTKWYEFDTNPHFRPGTKAEDKPGVLAFHTFPLAATCFLNKFQFKYKLNSNLVYSTPGLIKFETDSNDTIYKPVAFEVGVDGERVIHRAATTQPYEHRVMQSLQKLKQDPNEWVKYMKTISKLSAKYNNKSVLFHDQSYIVVTDKEKGLVLTKNNASSVEALIFLNK